MEDLHDVGGTPAVMKYAAREGPARRRLHDRHRQDARREPARPAGPRSRARRSSTRSRSRSSRPATSGSCAATSRPDGAVAKITGKEGLSFTGPANVLRLRRGHARTRSSRSRSTRATWSSSATKAPRAAPACPRCSRPPRAIMGAGLGERRRADHRRPLLRRLARLHRRPRHARGAGRRPDRAGARTATGSRIDAEQERDRPSTSPTPSSPPPRRLEGPAATRPPAARSTSTSRT